MSNRHSGADSTDSQESETTRYKAGATRLIWAVIVLLVAYPLSIGPVTRFYWGTPDFIFNLYEPLWTLCARYEVAGHAFVWYLNLWGVHATIN